MRKIFVGGAYATYIRNETESVAIEQLCFIASSHESARQIGAQLLRSHRAEIADNIKVLTQIEELDVNDLGSYLPQLGSHEAEDSLKLMLVTFFARTLDQGQVLYNFYTRHFYLFSIEQLHNEMKEWALKNFRKADGWDNHHITIRVVPPDMVQEYYDVITLTPEDDFIIDTPYRYQ